MASMLFSSSFFMLVLILNGSFSYCSSKSSLSVDINESSIHDHATKYLNTLRNNFEMPAIAIGEGYLWKPFSVVVAGVRKAGNPIKARTNDIWHLGSDTKALTATTIALLVQRGRLGWTTTLSEALPDYNVSEARRNIRVEELAAHISGFHEALIDHYAFYESLYHMSAAEGRRAMTERVVSVPHNATRGKYEYANANYVVLGAIIDRYAGTPAEDVMQRLLFAPLRMHTVGWGPNPEASNVSIENPWPHVLRRFGPVPVSGSFKQRDNPPALNTAGCAHMSPADWNKFLQLHLQGPDSPFGRAVGLSWASFVRLHTPYPETNKSSFGYGYTYGAWLRQNYTKPSGKYTLTHDGSNTYNYAVAFIDTKLKAIFFGLSNIGGRQAEDGTHSAVNAMRRGRIVLQQESRVVIEDSITRESHINNN